MVKTNSAPYLCQTVSSQAIHRSKQANNNEVLPLHAPVAHSSFCICPIIIRNIFAALSKKTDNDDLGFLPFEDGEFEKTGMEKNSVPISAMVVSAMAGLPSAAGAAGPDWGLFEGRTGSLIHPTVMGGLFLYSAYTAYLGFQWRRQRTLGDEISALKATLPKVPTPVTSDGTEDEAAAAEAAKVAAVAAPIEKEIQALQQERKDIAASGPRDKHFSQGAFLAFLGTSIAIEVCSDPF